MNDTGRPGGYPDVLFLQIKKKKKKLCVANLRTCYRALGEHLHICACIYTRTTLLFECYPKCGAIYFDVKFEINVVERRTIHFPWFITEMSYVALGNTNCAQSHLNI